MLRTKRATSIATKSGNNAFIGVWLLKGTTLKEITLMYEINTPRNHKR